MSELHSWAKLLGGEVSGDEIVCPGPGHTAKDRSLSVKIGRDGEPIVHSFCPADNDLECKDFARKLLGMEPFKPKGNGKASSTKRHFDYPGPDGALLYQVEREDLPDGGKKIRQRRPDGKDGWVWNLGGVHPVPYRLPELLEALAHGRTIVIAEGEAKVDLLWSWNVPATCNSGGAGKWRAHHSAYFAKGARSAGADVVILPDNDEPGRRHAEIVAASLKEAGATVRVLDLPGLGPKGDVIDWAAAGGTVEQLHALIERDARPCEAATAWALGEASNRQDKGELPPKPPSRVTGAGTFMRSYKAISYTIDGVLPSGYLYGLTAKPGTGKTAWMITATLAVETGREGILGCAVECGRVAFVTIENPVDFKMKLAVNCYFHNISFDQIESRVAIIDGRDTPEQIYEGLRLDADAHGDFQLVNFDTFQAGFAVANAGAFNDNEAVLKYVQRLRPLTVLPGLPSVLVAFHPTKNALEAELIPYGGGATYGEIDGNLTLWKEASIKFHWNRVRGPEFEPRFFRIEKLSCPDIVDKQGRQILLPVMRPSTGLDAEERAAQEGNFQLTLLQAMIEDKNGTQRDWGAKLGKNVSTVAFLLKKLEKQKLVRKVLDKWQTTPAGLKAARENE